MPGTLTHSATAPFPGQRAWHDRAAGGHHATALCVLARVVRHFCHWLALQSVRRGQQWCWLPCHGRIAPICGQGDRHGCAAGCEHFLSSAAGSWRPAACAALIDHLRSTGCSGSRRAWRGAGGVSLRHINIGAHACRCQRVHAHRHDKSSST